MNMTAQYTSSIMGDTEYLILLLCMVAIVVALFIWRQKITNGGFRFKNTAHNDTLHIVAQKPIDMKTRIVMVQTKETCYIILVGQNHSTLLDKIPITQTKSFQQYLNEESQTS